MQDYSLSDVFASIFSLIMFVTVILLPIVALIILKKFQSKLSNRRIKARISSLYNEIRVGNTHDINYTVCYTSIYLLRRLLFSIVVVAGQQYSIAQI